MRRAAQAAALAVALAAGPAGADPPHASPHVSYMLHCQGCHRPDGEGAPGAVPRLQGFVGNFLSVPGGREYLIRVPGSAQSPLDDAALAEVLNWMVRTFGPAEVAADFAPFTREEVARVRRPPLERVAEVRRGLVAAIEGRAASAARQRGAATR